MKTLQHFLIAGIFSAAISVFADVIEIENNTMLFGPCASGNVAAINFQTSAGVLVIKACALTFTVSSTQARRAIGKSTLPGEFVALEEKRMSLKRKYVKTFSNVVGAKKSVVGAGPGIYAA